VFLSAEDIITLTGIAKGARGRSREELQCEQLRSMGIPYYANARGFPIVARAFFESAAQRPPEPTAKPWTPSFASR
jgi:hypothetical protein